MFSSALNIVQLFTDAAVVTVVQHYRLPFHTVSSAVSPVGPNLVGTSSAERERASPRALYLYVLPRKVPSSKSKHLQLHFIFFQGAPALQTSGGGGALTERKKALRPVP